MSRLGNSARHNSRLLALVWGLAVTAILTVPALSQAEDSTPRPRDYARAVVPPADDSAEQPMQPEPPIEAAADADPKYVPPRRGAPRATVSGGVRGTRALPTPLALAPPHLAQTVTAQPSLFWYIDAVPAADHSLVFTLIDGDGIDPLVEASLERPRQAGIQRIQLADHGVKLAPGTEYEWSVALVVDPEQRAEDVVSTGYIRRVSQPSELKLNPPCVNTYADLGLWYDALESVSDSIDSAPENRALRSQRSSLLRQAGLDAAIE